jgi:predicted extracellular nuclease
VITGVPRPFREPGIEVPDPLPAGSPPGVPRFDANPERLRVDTTALSGGVPLNVTSNVVLVNVIGPLDYRVRTYTIDTDPASPPTATTPDMLAVPVRDATADEFRIASFNMERFFDTVDDAGSSDVALTPTAFNNRLSKASLAIRHVLRSPDIIGVEEMEHLSTLQAVADRVNADAVAAGDPNPNYQAYLEEGNDIGGIDVGLLVKSPRVTVVDVTQFGKATTYVEPGGESALLNDRPPLVLRAIVNSEAHPPYPVTVIVNHLRSLSGVDDPADGDRVRTKRRAQAEYLANLIQARQAADPTERIVSVGDYNAFQFNDGYVDVIGTIKGSPTPATEVVLASGDLVDPNLLDLVDFAPASQRYSYSFDGNAQELDHVLVTTGPQNSLRPIDLQYGRMDTDFPEIYRSDPNRPERLSDHDPLVAYFSLNAPPVCATATAAASMFPPNHTMQPVVISNVSDPDQDAVTLTVTAICQDEPPNAQPSIFGVDGTGVGTANAAIRAEVNHPGDGRVYHIFFDADDGKGGVCSGEVKVNVLVSPKGTAIDSGPLFDSTSPSGTACVVPGSRR